MPSLNENEFVSGMGKVVEGEKRSRPDITMRHNDGNVESWNAAGAMLVIPLPRAMEVAGQLEPVTTSPHPWRRVFPLCCRLQSQWQKWRAFLDEAVTSS
jgi:hypothetical protein